MVSWEDAKKFHGHECRGLAWGYKAGLFALEKLDFDRSSDEELVAIVENDSCAVDGIQVVTGCTFGKGNLIFRDYGKHIYTFFNRNTGKGIRISRKKGGKFRIFLRLTAKIYSKWANRRKKFPKGRGFSNPSSAQGAARAQWKRVSIY